MLHAHRRLARAGRAENDERPPVALGAHLSQLFKRTCDLAAAAIEQGCVGVVIAERGEAGERGRPQPGVCGERLGVEPDARVGAGLRAALS
jgi:hypothetical protein